MAGRQSSPCRGIWYGRQQLGISLSKVHGGGSRGGACIDARGGSWTAVAARKRDGFRREGGTEVRVLADDA